MSVISLPGSFQPYRRWRRGLPGCYRRNPAARPPKSWCCQTSCSTCRCKGSSLCRSQMMLPLQGGWWSRWWWAAPSCKRRSECSIARVRMRSGTSWCTGRQSSPRLCPGACTHSPGYCCYWAGWWPTLHPFSTGPSQKWYRPSTQKFHPLLDRSSQSRCPPWRCRLGRSAPSP